MAIFHWTIPLALHFGAMGFLSSRFLRIYDSFYGTQGMTLTSESVGNGANTDRLAHDIK